MKHEVGWQSAKVVLTGRSAWLDSMLKQAILNKLLFSVFFLSFLMGNAGMLLQLGQDSFIPNYFQYINLPINAVK
jgi:hypothetical protein